MSKVEPKEVTASILISSNDGEVNNLEIEGMQKDIVLLLLNLLGAFVEHEILDVDELTEVTKMVVKRVKKVEADALAKELEDGTSADTEQA